MKLKTNMRMNVAIGGMEVAVEHKTGLVDVNDLARLVFTPTLLLFSFLIRLRAIWCKKQNLI